MAQNELSVDLRLALKKLKEDIREANRMIKEGMSKSLNLGGSTKGTKDAGDEMDKVATKTRRATTELERQLAVWKKLQNFRKINITDNSLPSSKGRQGYVSSPANYAPILPKVTLPSGSLYQGPVPPMIPPPMLPKTPTLPEMPSIPLGDAAIFWRRMITGLLAGFRNPAGMGSVIAGNQFFGAFGNTATGGRALGAMGLGAGAGGAALATGGLLVGIAALAAAIKSLQLTVRESIAASERARALYAKTIQSGTGLQYNAQTSNIARAMGVSSMEIYQFGGALDFLYPRLKQASRISADSAVALTPLAYELSILKTDIEALFDTLAVEAVPALRFFVNLLDELAKSMQEAAKYIVPIIKTFLSASLPPGADKQKLMNDLSFVASTIAGPFSGILARALADTSRNLQMPSAFMKQMPVSNFERMGLVASMSSSGLVDYSRRTAVATETIARHVIANGGVPRSMPFGFDPQVSNP